MLNSSYLVVTAAALLIVIVFSRYLVRLNNTFFIFDAFGLGLFTVVGIEKTLAAGFPFWVAVIMGAITGAAGGVLRDILAGDMPYILRKHIYASASIAGGILYLLLQQVWQGAGAILTSVVVVIVIRCAAAHFEWNLPRAKTVWKSDE